MAKKGWFFHNEMGSQSKKFIAEKVEAAKAWLEEDKSK